MSFSAFVRHGLSVTIGGTRAALMVTCLAAFPLAFALPVLGADKTTKGSAKGSKAKVEAGEEGGDEDDLALDEDVTALAPPARVVGLPSPETRQKFSHELQTALKLGFNGRAEGLDAAKRHIEAAQKAVPDDPRSAYACGVILMAHDKPRVALEEFRAAAARNRNFLPGLEGSAWVLLSRGDYSEGITALRTLIQRVEQSSEQWPTAHDRERSAEFIGRMVGFLTGPGKKQERAAEIDSLAADAANMLGAERKQAFERGRKATAAVYQQQKTLTGKAAEQALADLKSHRDENQAAADTAAADVKRITNELIELKQPREKEMAELSQQIRADAVKAKNLGPRIARSEAEASELSTAKKHAKAQYQGTRRPSRLTVRNENEGEKRIRESQLASANQKTERLEAEQQETTQSIADAKKKRTELFEEYRKFSAPKRKVLFEAQLKRAELAARVNSAGLTADQLAARVRELETYVPFYAEIEQQRLLSTLGAN